MHSLKYLVIILFLFTICTRCRHHISEHRDFYVQKMNTEHRMVASPNKPVRFLDILCTTCYRLLPSNQQKFYKKKIK